MSLLEVQKHFSATGICLERIRSSHHPEHVIVSLNGICKNSCRGNSPTYIAKQRLLWPIWGVRPACDESKNPIVTLGVYNVYEPRDGL